MRKLKSFILSSLIVILSCGCFASCKKTEERLERIQQVKPEVSYGYTAIGGNSIAKDCKIYDYEEMAYNLIKKECELYIYGTRLIGNDFYFLYQYDSHGKTKKDKDGKSINSYSFDVGLFRTDAETLSCEQVYDFQNVYPTHNYTYINQYLGNILDENRMVVQYNGSIQILDLQQKKITHSIDVYDKEKFRSCQFFPYRFNEYGDYEMIIDDTLYYYEIEGYAFTLHKFKINPDSFYVDRWGDYVYTSNYTNKMECYDCYDLTDNQAVDLNILFEEMKESDNQQERPEKDAYILDEKKYYLNFSYREHLEILDENKNQTAKIDEAFMRENSRAFMDLYDLWTKKHREYELVDFTVVENKLFLGFSAPYAWAARTPVYIYEYDIKSNKVLYVGFCADNIGSLRLHEKS